MFNRIQSAKTDIHCFAILFSEARRFRKEADAAAKKEKAHAKMIAASQAKIGPYTPASIPVQVYA